MPGKNSQLLSRPLFKLMMLFNVIVVIIFLSIIYDSLGAQLHHQQALLSNFSRSLQLRVDTYRFATWQIYQNQNSTTDSDDEDTAATGLQEIRLRPDIYAPVTEQGKTQALIFGSHGSSTLATADNISDFLNTLWGIKKNVWSMYYLNGQDNSMTMVSTLPLKDMMVRYNGESITGLVSTRRAEMLQQANTLDERESFSDLRHTADSDDYYFTLRTTFNQPGHLATVLAFDLPINDLLTGNLRPDRMMFHDTDSGNPDLSTADRVNLATASVELLAPLSSSSMVISYQVSILMLINQALHEFALTLCLCLLLLLLSLAASFLLRRYQTPQEDNSNPELELLRILNKEMVDSLPVGFVIYDFNAHREVVSNEKAAQLIPHLNLQKIVSLSENVQGVLQVTINNEVYEVRHQQSRCSPQYRFFIISNQDREILINKKLQHAQKVLDKNHLIRRQLLENIGRTFRQPVSRLRNHLSALQDSVALADWQPLADYSDHLLRLTDNIILLNELENHRWSADEQSFSLQKMLDEIVTELLPSLNPRGLDIIVNNLRPADEIRRGDSTIVRKILMTLLWYSFGTTRWGKISVRISASPEQTDRLMVNIVDTGQGLNKTELENAHFPFSGDVSTLNDEKSNSMDLFFCRQFCQALNGKLDIVSKPDLGTHYSVTLSLPVQAQETEQDEKILDGITVLVDVVVDDIYKIVSRQLEYWGAKCVIADERVSVKDYDFLITDVPARLSGWAVLITGTEPGYSAISPQQYRANYNLNQAFLEALLSLIEKQLTEDEMEDAPETTGNSVLEEPGYFQIFKDTVPDDVTKLSLELADKDYAALALTAHRLKGVFAMLGLEAGKAQCEQLELFIEKCDDLNIKDAARDIDDYVNKLLQQGK